MGWRFEYLFEKSLPDKTRAYDADVQGHFWEEICTRVSQEMLSFGEEKLMKLKSPSKATSPIVLEVESTMASAEETVVPADPVVQSNDVQKQDEEDNTSTEALMNMGLKEFAGQKYSEAAEIFSQVSEEMYIFILPTDHF